MAIRQYPKKITPSTIGLKTPDLEKVAAEKATKMPLSVARIYGRVGSMETGQTQYGPYVRFIGEFEAVNLIDESIHRSKNMILPAQAETCLLEQIGSVKQGKEDITAVEIGIDLTIEYYKSPTLKGTEFKWGVRPLREPDGEDSLSKLGKEFGNLPLLNAPEKSSKKPSKK